MIAAGIISLLSLFVRTANFQRDSTLIMGHKWLQTLHLQRPIDLTQLFLDQSSMHGAHRRCFAFSQVILCTWEYREPERILIKFGLKPHIFEVRVKRVDLMLGIDTDLVTLVERRVDTTQQVSLGLRFSSPRISPRVHTRCLHRFKHHRWPSATTCRNRPTHDESLVFEHPQVIARSVDMKADRSRKLIELLARHPLDFVQQLYSAGLSQPAVVLDSTGHTRSLLR